METHGEAEKASPVCSIGTHGTAKRPMILEKGAFIMHIRGYIVEYDLRETAVILGISQTMPFSVLYLSMTILRVALNSPALMLGPRCSGWLRAMALSFVTGGAHRRSLTASPCVSIANLQLVIINTLCYAVLAKKYKSESFPWVHP